MPAKLFLFDLDCTLIKVNASFAFGRFLFQQGKISPLKLFKLLAYYARYKYLGFPIQTLQERIFECYFKGKDLDDIAACVQYFLTKNLEKLLYQPAIRHLKNALEEKQPVAILSSSPDFLVGPIAKSLQVEHWYASCYAVDKDRKLCHIASVVLGKTKAELVKRLALFFKVEKKHIAAYSDSYLDLPFLEEAGNPIGVNPDRKLLRFCQEKHWEVI